MQLLNQSKNNLFVANVIEARTFFQRTRGLMFRQQWCEKTTLWIHRCNSIHTAFVRFPIDVVFVDKTLKIKKVIRDLKPWRLVLPVLSAHSVFEFVSGYNYLDNLQVGDELYVGH